MIVSGGENVFPREVEDLLASHDEVAEVAVIGVDDDEFGQRLRAFVVLNDGADASEEDLKGHVKAHLAGFLVQYWGGPTTYSEERGHPALRMRHAPFAISEVERDAWLEHMTASLDALAVERGVGDAVRNRVLEYVTGAADFLVNTR